jgi:hypothetical protein
MALISRGREALPLEHMAEVSTTVGAGDLSAPGATPINTTQKKSATLSTMTSHGVIDKAAVLASLTFLTLFSLFSHKSDGRTLALDNYNIYVFPRQKRGRNMWRNTCCQIAYEK